MCSFFCGFVLVATFALGSPLCVPEQWEGQESSTMEYASQAERGLIEEYIEASYDAKNNRSSIFLQSVQDGHWSFYRILMLFNSTMGHRYVINLRNDDCTVTLLKQPFRPTCIQDGSYFTGTFSLGPLGVFNVTSYHFFHGAITYNTIVYREGDIVIPVMETVSGKSGDYLTAKTTAFRNIKPGIESENVFKVPEECSDDDAWLANAPHLTRGHQWMAL